MTTRLPHEMTEGIYSKSEVDVLISGLQQQIIANADAIFILENRVTATEQRLDALESGATGYVLKSGDVMTGNLTAPDFVLT